MKPGVSDELILGDAAALVNEGMAVTLLVKGGACCPSSVAATRAWS